MWASSSSCTSLVDYQAASRPQSPESPSCPIGKVDSERVPCLRLSCASNGVPSDTSQQGIRSAISTAGSGPSDRSTALEVARDYFGRRINLSGPQYHLLMTVAQLQGATGVSVGSVAQAMHVSSSFITSETGKLSEWAY